MSPKPEKPSKPPATPTPPPAATPPIKPPSHKKRWVVLTTLLLILIGGSLAYAISRPDKPEDSQSKRTQAIPAKTINQTGALKLEPVSVGNCAALLPTGWPTPTTNQASTSFDAFSPDKAMYAGYGHQTINTKLAPVASVYSPPLNDPDLYSADPATVALAYTKILIDKLGGDHDTVAYTTATNETFGEYQLRSVASGTHQGVVFFHNSGYGGDGVNYSYSIPMYFALATTSAWQTNGLSLARVAASIKCSAQLVARESGPDLESSSVASDHSSEADANGDADGYNPQLGTEYVHDRSTGENYVVDPSRDWSSDGPNGGGYYKQSGNDYTQLEPGRSD